MPAGMVVEQHLPALGHAGEREHHLDGAPRHGADPGHDADVVHVGHERHFPATGRADLGRQQAVASGVMRASGSFTERALDR